MSSPAHPSIRIREVANIGDARGGSYSIPEEWNRFLPSAIDLHVTTLGPGRIRGNHFHRTRREVIVVLHHDAWTLHWDEGTGSETHIRLFPGSGAVMLTVDPGAAHAIVNSGTRELVTVGLTDGPYDPDDTVRKELAGPRAT